MKLKSLTEEQPVEQAAVPLNTTFKERDVVTIKRNEVKHVSSHSSLIGKKLIVLKNYFADLGDMEVEVLYLASNDYIKLKNPYLAKHFKPYKNETTNT